jgi:hypothetical protein
MRDAGPGHRLLPHHGESVAHDDHGRAGRPDSAPGLDHHDDDAADDDHDDDALELI